ncbi:hypothetical protein [Stenomitos frigidus]|uniref:hypothetical protein n=1 Tax=Stenomitos frigidus TaxID=1886765 RepID=UPI0011B205C4|nr:hypothetical protein [Stenomitos frigidus]
MAMAAPLGISRRRDRSTSNSRLFQQLSDRLSAAEQTYLDRLPLSELPETQALARVFNSRNGLNQIDQQNSKTDGQRLYAAALTLVLIHPLA